MYYLIDPRGLTNEISIEGANNDTGVCGCRAMQTNEMEPIQRQYGSPFGDGEGQYILIRDGIARIASLAARQDVVPQPAQPFNYEEWEVFVGVQAGHSLRRLVLRDLHVDLVAMNAIVGPGIDQIFRVQRRIGS